MIFRYTDTDGDELEVSEPDPEELERHRGSLLFTVTQRGRDQSSALTAIAVDGLIGALERWRSGTTSTPPADPEPIYTALIRRLVTDEVARVLPLHRAPQSLPPACQTPVGCVASLPEDPEPHDVGHADEPADHGRLMSELQRAAVRVPKCTTCNHFWSDHTGEMCWGHSKCGCAQERP